MRRFTVLHVAMAAGMIVGFGGLLWWLIVQLKPTQGLAYYFFVDDTSSLPEGTEVKFRGLSVGQVVRVALDEAGSRAGRTPKFRVEFQLNPQGEKVFDIWTFHKVALAKETPLIGATVVTLTEDRAANGETPTHPPLDRLKATGYELTLDRGSDGLSDQLQDIAERVRALVDNADAAVRSVRSSLGARPEGLSDDRAANLALVMGRDVYAVDDAAGVGPARPTRLAAVLNDISVMARSFGQAGDSIAAFARSDGAVDTSFQKFGVLSERLSDPTQPLQAALIDLKKTTTSAREDLGKYGTLAARITPSVDQATKDAEQMLDTLKREPWRIIWKSTKQYDDAHATPTPAPAANPRKGRPASPTATPASKKAH